MIQCESLEVYNATSDPFIYNSITEVQLVRMPVANISYFVDYWYTYLFTIEIKGFG